MNTKYYSKFNVNWEIKDEVGLEVISKYQI